MSIKQNGGVFGRNPTFNDVTIEGQLTFEGNIDIDSDITWEDDKKALFGDSGELAIYHHNNGTSYIQETGSGDLSILGTNFRVMNAAGTQNKIVATTGGAVTLYENNNPKIATTSSGVDVTGTASVDKLAVGVSTAGTPLHVTSGTDNNIANDVSEGRIIGADKALVGEQANLVIQTNDDMAINKGGSIGFGGRSTTSSTNGNNFAQIGGRKENGTSGNYSGYLSFGTSDSASDIHERMTISSTGNVSIPNGNFSVTDGSTTLARTNGAPLEVNRSNDGILAYFKSGGIVRGSISISGSTTAYNTSSDYRLKEDWQPMSGATDRLKELKPVNFAWKADGSRVDGFLAHEAQEVVPESVTGSKDAMQTEEYEVSPAVYEDVVTPAVEAVEAEYDEEGNVVVEAVEAQEERTESQVVTEAVMGEREVPDYQGIDQSKLVPLLVATIQELEARITALES